MKTWETPELSELSVKETLVGQFDNFNESEFVGVDNDSGEIFRGNS